MALEASSEYVINTHDLSRSAGSSKQYELSLTPMKDFTNGAVAIDEKDLVEVSVLLESVIDGILTTGTAQAIASGECSRCLDPVRIDLIGDIADLYAYSDKDIRTDEADEVRILQGDLLDLEPAVRDALVLAMPLRPLCNDMCLGLCGQCGIRLDDEPDHVHEVIDPRWARLTELKKEN
jgi:uncharacterized protein